MAPVSERPHSQQLHELALKALTFWGLKGRLSLIKERENSVYAFDNGAQRYVLRVHRHGYHDDRALASEHLWVRALAAAGLAVPEPIRTPDGRDFVHVSTARISTPRQVDLLAWIDGEQLGSVEAGLGRDAGRIEAIYRCMGATAAQFHNQAANWAPPRDFYRHSWDLDGLLGEQPFWGRFWELAELTAAQRALVTKARAALALELQDYGQSTNNYSLIHADFVPENLLVQGDRVHVVDFDDAGFGWHMFELATALYFIQDDPAYALAASALIAGYRQCRPLADADVDRLPAFLAARSLTYLGWTHQRRDSRVVREMIPMLIEKCCATLNRYFTAS